MATPLDAAAGVAGLISLGITAFQGCVQVLSSYPPHTIWAKMHATSEAGLNGSIIVFSNGRSTPVWTGKGMPVLR